MNNPLVDEGIIKKVKHKFGKKDNDDFNMKNGIIQSTLIGMNDWINICAEACSCCLDRPIPDDIEGRAEYIAKRSKIGHTSVLEHSNFAIYTSVPVDYSDDLITFISWCCKYLEYKMFKSYDGTKWHLIIGGSLRGFANIIRETEDINNPILKSIMNIMHIYANSCAFMDLCNLGLLDKSNFNDTAITDIDADDLILSSYKESNDKMDIIADSLTKFYKRLNVIDEEAAKRLTTFDAIKFVSVTVLFKNMSRTGTHQLVRHRNAITQESQRYVDYNKAYFSSPDEFKPEKYDSNHKYNVSFAGGPNQSLTLKEIGEAECALYRMLSKDSLAANCKLLKEDARAFLPGNVQCKRIYMTFTYKNLFKFLYLREDKAAQAEIRSYALKLGEWFRKTIPMGKEMIDTYANIPRLCMDNPIVIDDVSYTDEVLPDHLEEDAYIKAIGLDKDEEDREDENRETSKENEV